MVTLNNSLYAEADIIALSGNTFDAVVEIYDADNVAVDLSNYSLLFSIYKGARLMLALSDGYGFTVSGNAITFNELIKFAPCELTYELVATSTIDGTIKTFLIGNFIVS